MLIIDQTPSTTEGHPAADDVSTDHRGEQEPVDVVWKGKGKATAQNDDDVIVVITPDTCPDVSADDWVNYKPPQGLRETGDMDSDVVLRIVQESIDRVQARIRKEEERKSAVQEARRRSREERANGKAKQQPESVDGPPLNDAAGTDPPSSRSPSPDRNASAETDGTGWFPSELPRRPKKRTLMNLFRKTNSGPENGESSAAGAARHKFLTYSSQTDLATPSARKRFVLDLIKKATREGIGSSSTSSAQGLEVECVSCLEDFKAKDTVRAPCHNYCTPCFRRLIASACRDEQRWPPKCCLNPIPDGTILVNVDELQRIEYRERAREWNMPVADRIYCSQPDCGLFIRPEYVITAQGVARCTDGHYTCISCRNARHEGGDGDCPQDRDLMRTNELAEAEGWKRCHGCHAYVEHREACQHMTCRCGAEFCYVCGARWRTCACTMAHLTQAKQEASARRRARLEREAEEDAAAQEAIRLVAAFEREEALKAELLRQEQARVAEAALAARIAREGERRRAVMLRFEALGAVLQSLHETQRAAVRAHHDRREQRLREGGETALRRLLDAHGVARVTQAARAEARIAGREARLEDEYAARAAEERRVGEQYDARLRAFWAGRRGGEDETRAAMDDLRRRMDAGRAAWRAWADGELDAYRHHVREEHAIAGELMDDKERRLRDRLREDGLALARWKAAELRWVREVVAERTRLLEELELDEIENGEDIDSWFAEGPLEEALYVNPWEGTRDGGKGGLGVPTSV